MKWISGLDPEINVEPPGTDFSLHVKNAAIPFLSVTTIL